MTKLDSMDEIKYYVNCRYLEQSLARPLSTAEEASSRRSIRFPVATNINNFASLKTLPSLIRKRTGKPNIEKRGCQRHC